VVKEKEHDFMKMCMLSELSITQNAERLFTLFNNKTHIFFYKDTVTLTKK
jgi:hypothetical protein